MGRWLVHWGYFTGQNMLFGLIMAPCFRLTRSHNFGLIRAYCFGLIRIYDFGLIKFIVILVV